MTTEATTDARALAMVDLDGRSTGGVKFVLRTTEALVRCRTDAEIDAQADKLREQVDEVAAKMKVELARQVAERQL